MTRGILDGKRFLAIGNRVSMQEILVKQIEVQKRPKISNHHSIINIHVPSSYRTKSTK